MRCNVFRLILICAAAALLLSAATATAQQNQQQTPVPTKAEATAKTEAEAKAKAEATAKAAAEAKAKAEAAAKAKAEAEATANGVIYNDAKICFDSWIKSNQLERAAAAARTMLESSANPGKDGGWRNPAQTYDYLAKAFSDKKIFGRKQAMALYDEAINKLSGIGKANLLLQYGFYLEDYALADTAKAQAFVDQAFQVADLSTDQKIDLCKSAAQKNQWAELDAYAQKALAFAGADLKAQASIWQWRLAANIRDKSLDELCKDYDTFLANKTFKDFIHGANTPFKTYVDQLIWRKEFDKALALLNTVPDELDDNTRLAYRRQKADLYTKAAERYDDKPDAELLKKAIATYEAIIADIPTNRPRDVIPYQMSIAELAWQTGDSQRARTTATATLQLINQPENRESHQLLYLLGHIAYEAKEYAEATRILEEAYGYIQGKPGHFPKRREMVEDLVRSACAIGDYAKSAGYADDLLELVRRHEKKRYQIYIDGLKERVPSSKR